MAVRAVNLRDLTDDELDAVDRFADLLRVRRSGERVRTELRELLARLDPPGLSEEGIARPAQEATRFARGEA